MFCSAHHQDASTTTTQSARRSCQSFYGTSTVATDRGCDSFVRSNTAATTKAPKTDQPSNFLEHVVRSSLEADSLSIHHHMPSNRGSNEHFEPVSENETAEDREFSDSHLGRQQNHHLSPHDDRNKNCGMSALMVQPQQAQVQTPEPSTQNEGQAIFPTKLFRMLEDAQRYGFEGTVSWEPCGTMFKVHDRQRFESVIMPYYFLQTKFKSFLRQLNLYRFRRVSRGPSKGAYAHELFVRNNPKLCIRLKRPARRTEGAAKKEGGSKTPPAVTEGKSSTPSLVPPEEDFGTIADTDQSLCSRSNDYNALMMAPTGDDQQGHLLHQHEQKELLLGMVKKEKVHLSRLPPFFSLRSTTRSTTECCPTTTHSDNGSKNNDSCSISTSSSYDNHSHSSVPGAANKDVAVSPLWDDNYLQPRPINEMTASNKGTRYEPPFVVGNDLDPSHHPHHVYSPPYSPSDIMNEIIFTFSKSFWFDSI